MTASGWPNAVATAAFIMFKMNALASRARVGQHALRRAYAIFEMLCHGNRKRVGSEHVVVAYTVQAQQSAYKILRSWDARYFAGWHAILLAQIGGGVYVQLCV